MQKPSSKISSRGGPGFPPFLGANVIFERSTLKEILQLEYHFWEFDNLGMFSENSQKSTKHQNARNFWEPPKKSHLFLHFFTIFTVTVAIISIIFAPETSGSSGSSGIWYATPWDFCLHIRFEKNEEDMTDNHSQMLNVWYIYLHLPSGIDNLGTKKKKHIFRAGGLFRQNGTIPKLGPEFFPKMSGSDWEEDLWRIWSSFWSVYSRKLRWRAPKRWFRKGNGTLSKWQILVSMLDFWSVHSYNSKCSTLSPTIMVQWKMAQTLKGIDPIGGTPIFDFQDFNERKCIL